MTTIIADRTMICCDSMCSDSDSKWSVIKAIRIGGSLYATAGGAAEGERFLDWIRRKQRGKVPIVSEEFSALMLRQDGLWLFDSQLVPMPLLNAHAIGSGCKAARGALMAGASLHRAVEIACEIDAGSSLPVQTYLLEETA